MSHTDSVFRALADPSRRAVFGFLGNGEASVNEIKAQFSISQPAVSQHLAILRAAGLVSERRQGRLRYYHIEPSGLEPLIDWLKIYERFWDVRFQRLQEQLTKENNE